MNKFLMALALLVTTQVNATAVPCDANDSECTPVDKWRFGIALGGGVISNPLHDGENIPLVIVPYVSYYGEHLFLDNGTLGYTFYYSDKFDLSLIGTFNTEQAYFEKFHPSNIFVQKMGFDASEQLPGGEFAAEQTAISLDEIESRKWAVDGGVLAHWVVNDRVKVSASWLTDITNTYQGYNADIGVSYRFRFDSSPNTYVFIKGGLKWKSRQLIDYYYGIDKADIANSALWYKGSSSFQPYISFAYSYPVSKSWTFKFNAKYQQLDNAMTDSPIVEDSYTATVFVGGKYEF
ncbi:MipA/OmpV family protein [Pseudoalteromonas sp. A757]|uniref:MipA/OmpV family protein n=1 Tax=Pseudoalteromonas sp. A757 TaxID=2250709 RepID=UPI001F001995|nr:MipA/OmpV family protein [Pseudoalteromonas sp. A757]